MTLDFYLWGWKMWHGANLMCDTGLFIWTLKEIENCMWFMGCNVSEKYLLTFEFIVDAI